MVGIVMRLDPQGFGIIKGTDGRRVPFVESDLAPYQRPRTGQKVVFSIRRVEGRIFASNVCTYKHPLKT